MVPGRNPIEKAKNLVTFEFEIVTVNAAVMNSNIVEVFGPDTVQYNMNGVPMEIETAGTTVEARLKLDKILTIYQKGFLFSIKYKSKLPEFIKAVEYLIELLHRVKGVNVKEEIIYVPNTMVTLRELVNFYLMLVDNNRELVNDLLVNELKGIDNGLLIIGNDKAVATSSIRTGSQFINDVISDGNIINSKNTKNKMMRLRDGY